MSKPSKIEHFLNVSEFKAKCLGLLEATSKRGKEYIIAKKGVPIARIIPIHKRTATRRGSLKGLAQIHGDIIHFDSSPEWEALKS